MGSDVNDRRYAISRWFYGELQQFHIRAGEPTVSQIEEISREQPGMRDLPHSTVHDILTGKRLRLPDPELLKSFVTACRTYAERIRSPHRLPTVDDWQFTRYKASLSALDTAPWPVFTGIETGPDAVAERSPEQTALATMLALADHGPLTGWWRDYRDVVPEWLGIYFSLEPAAELVRAYETKAVPDLLQTEEYARRLLRRAGLDAGEEIDRRVELLMRRREILYRPEDATTLWAILDAGIFEDPAVPVPIMRAQIDHLIQVGRQPNISLQIMPGAHGSTPAGHPTAGAPITILRFRDRELPDVVYLAQPTGGLYPDSPQDIAHYAQVMDRLGIEAEKRAETMDILADLRKGL